MKPTLKVERVALSSLKLDPKNARKHSERNIQSVFTSLKDHGQVEPLIVRTKNRQIIGGECRYLAMRERLKWTHADVIFLDIGVKEARALSLRLNRTAELAEWDFSILTDDLAYLEKDYDLPELGWLPHESEPLLKADWTPPALTDLPTRGESKPSHTFEEKQTIANAYEACRVANKNSELSDDQCLVLICQAYINAAKPKARVARAR